MRVLRGSVAWRLVLWFLILSALPMAVMAVFLRYTVADSFVNLILRELESEAGLVAVALRDAPSPELQADVLARASEDARSVMLLDSGGMVAVWRDGVSVRPDNASVPDAVRQEALRRSPGAVADAAQLRAYAFAPIPGGTKVIVIASEPRLVRVPMALIEGSAFVQLALSLIVVAVAGGVAIWIIIGPILRLTEAAEAIGGGNLEARIDESDMEGELLVLTRSFNQMAGQLQRSYALLNEQVAERTRDLAILNRIASVVGRPIDLDAVLDDALTTVLQRLDFEAGAICIADEASGEIRLAKCRGFRGNLCRLEPWIGLIDETVRLAQPVMLGSGQGTDDMPAEAVAMGLRFVAAVPLVAQGRVEGVLITSDTRDRPVTASQFELLTSVGRQIGVGVQNRALHGQARQLAVLDERQRLARDLHDSVTQSLYGVTLYAEAAARLAESGDLGGCAEHLRQTRDSARSALREMRLLIYELRPADLEAAGLGDALRTRIELVEARAGIRTTVDIDDELHFSAVAEEEIYRIAQEALNNSLKHAQAKHLGVSLRRVDDAGSAVLVVSDDGVGMDIASAREHAGLGLRSMAERAARIGGSLAIESTPGSGTVVRLEVSV